MLRDAGPEDAPALAALVAESYRTAFAEILEPEDLAQRDAAFFEGYFAQAWPFTRVMERGGEIAGFARMTGAHLDMLFVDARFHGQGLGAALLADAEARGARSLEAFAANLDARRFYEARGWVKTQDYERVFLDRLRVFVRYEKWS